MKPPRLPTELTMAMAQPATAFGCAELCSDKTSVWRQALGTIMTDSDGDLQTNSKDLIKHLRIPFPLAEHLKTVTPLDQVLTADVDETNADASEDVVDYDPLDANSHDENR